MVENLDESLAVRVTLTERRAFEAAAAAKDMRPSAALRLAMREFVERHTPPEPKVKVHFEYIVGPPMTLDPRKEWGIRRDE